ncbi:MAG TPA: betaine/proline/choline family ABC transporter ATP-binding protein [Jiangellaceae bacterium]|nr:betaine/proline/choline family ABC transporter ATP-binding protein [Jiangellaceae bacterium]
MTSASESHSDDPNAEIMIRLDGVSKRYPDGTVAVESLDLEARRGELVVLVGPSGCGKTTTMRMVNRLTEPSTGRVVIDGDDVTHSDPVKLRRGMGYVIQNVGLFPHQTILANVATVPELLGWSKAERTNRARDLLGLVGLEPDTFAHRYPHELSGGQRQRVGVARALAADPPILLMDEPFSAVDPVVRSQLQDEFLRLQDDVHKTILFVTHDIEEAVRLGDRIAVFRQGGHLEQFDTPGAILGNPATEFVGDFVGADRGLKRLSVTPITEADLDHPPVVRAEDRLATADLGGSRWAVVLQPSSGLAGWIGRTDVGDSGTIGASAKRMDAWVELGDSLKVAFAEMLQWNAGWIAVLDHRERFLGVLTPSTLHAALRRSVEAEANDVEPADVELDQVSSS